MKKTRVLHITPGMGVGGIPSVIKTLFDYGDHDRFEYSVLCLNYVGDVGEQMIRDGYDVTLLDMENTSIYLGSLRVRDHLKAGNFDVVHTHNTEACIDGVSAAAWSRVPTIIHTDHARNYPDKLRYILAERLMFRFATKVVGVSDHTSECLVEHHRIDRRKLLTIPNGIDGKVFSGPRSRAFIEAEGLPHEDRYLGIACRLVDQKSIPDLLKAMSIIAPRIPDVRLLIVGQGPLRESLEASLPELGIEDRVHFLGVRHNMPELLAALDIFVLPSIWEGLPMVILEAMAAGCPIVATSVGGVPTAVRDGVNGLVVPSRRPDLFAEALEKALGDPELLERFSDETRRVFREDFSAERMTEKYEALYLGQGNGARS